ncbi:MAG: YraN family protein [Candidatus Omnitrophica bacterium]|nr:YraN family protein [Candidatus Omnitrophota bacterium]
MRRSNLYLGNLGEEAALEFLKASGYKILARNYKSKLGEIDIIAADKDTVCFIEVKARASDRFGLPQEALSGFKQRQISKAALGFLKDKKLLEKRARFDVIALTYQKGSPKIELIKDAFELSPEFTY